MLDANGKTLRLGDQVVTLKRDGIVKPGSIGYVVAIKRKDPGERMVLKYPEKARVNDTGSDNPDDWTWSGWYQPDEIALVVPSPPKPEEGKVQG